MKIESKRDFSQILHGCIQDGLENALGESGMKVVLLNTELTRYADHPEELHRNLYDVFKEGAFVLEKVIARELFQRLGVPYKDESDFDFARHVNRAKECFIAGQASQREIEIERKSKRENITQPHLKVIRVFWQGRPVKTSFVVIDLNSGHEYPQNFLCIFPKNLFKRNRKGLLKRSKFFRFFGEKSHEVARSMLEDALKKERDLEIRRQIESSLREVKEALHQRM